MSVKSSLQPVEHRANVSMKVAGVWKAESLSGAERRD